MDKIRNWFNVNYERLVNNTNKITRDKEKTFDILHECVISFLQMPETRQLEILENGKIEHFITSCINIQFKSSTSPYHSKYRKRQWNEIEFIDWKHDLDIEEEISEYDEVCNCIFKEIDNLHFYYRILITDKYILGLTYQQLNEKYKISKNSLLKDVHTGVAMLKEKCITI